MADFEFELKNGAYTLKKYVGTATQVAIPSTYNGKPVTAIGNVAFCLCQNLTRVTIPNSVISIGNSAFNSCRKLEEISLPSGLKSIGLLAFFECRKLTNVIIPSSVETIGDEAFSYCLALKSVTIGEKVTYIGRNAFFYCRNLTSATFQRPFGWFVAMNRDATTGFYLPRQELTDPAAAARGLCSKWLYNYWKRKQMENYGK